MANKKKLTRGQMADARRKSAEAGPILAFEKYANPGVGYVFPKTGRKLTVSDEVARFGAYPSMGGVPATSYDNKELKKKPKKKK
jgi:hypothetical protein